MEDDDTPKKLSHKQKQRAAKRAKKKAELVEKKKALKLAKKNVAKQTEVKVANKEESVKGTYFYFLSAIQIHLYVASVFFCLGFTLYQQNIYICKNAHTKCW